jgi:fluoride exporter
MDHGGHVSKVCFESTPYERNLSLPTSNFNSPTQHPLLSFLLPKIGNTYFRDFVSNMMGSFIIGMFAPTTSLNLDTDKSLAIFPSKHPWQYNTELQTGIRTGYCGCLTTFASWMLQVMVPAISANKWLEAVFMLVVGLYASVASFTVGTHVALYVDRWLLPSGQKEDVLKSRLEFREEEINAYRKGEELEMRGGSRINTELMAEEPDIPRLVPTKSDSGSVAPTSPPPHHHGSPLHIDRENDAEIGQGGDNTTRSGTTAVGAGSSSKDMAREMATDEVLKEQQHANKTDAFVGLLFISCTAALAVGAALETEHTWLRSAWFCSLFAPFGCILRWYLSRFNYTLPGQWAWLPAGTLGANLVGCISTFALQCPLTRTSSSSLGYWGTLLLPAVQVGFVGSLTTVSTMVTEIAKLLEVFPDSIHGYTYVMMSLGGGVLSGLIVYGWAVWD